MNSIISKITLFAFSLFFALGLVIAGAAVTAFYHDIELLIASI